MRQGSAGAEVEDGDAGAGGASKCTASRSPRSAIERTAAPAGSGRSSSLATAPRRGPACAAGRHEIDDAADDGGKADDQDDAHDDNRDLEMRNCARAERLRAAALSRCGRVMGDTCGAALSSGLSRARMDDRRDGSHPHPHRH